MMTDPYSFLTRSKIQLDYNKKNICWDYTQLATFLFHFDFHTLLLVV